MVKKEGNAGFNIASEDLSMVNQIVDSLDKSINKLEEYYEKNQPEKFNDLKKLMISLSKKMSEKLR